MIRPAAPSRPAVLALRTCAPAPLGGYLTLAAGGLLAAASGAGLAGNVNDINAVMRVMVCRSDHYTQAFDIAGENRVVMGVMVLRGSRTRAGTRTHNKTITSITGGYSLSPSMGWPSCGGPSGHDGHDGLFRRDGTGGMA